MTRKPTKKEALIGGVSLAITIAVCVAIIRYRGFLSSEIQQYGYLGGFAINVLAGGTVVAPGLNVLVIFTMGGVLNPAIVGVVGGLGEAVGALGGYFVGFSGRGLFREGDKGSLYSRFADMMQRHGTKGVFFMASIVNPVYYPFAVFLGMLRFGLVRFFFLTWGGRTMKNVIIAYVGYFGLRSVLQFFGLNF